MKEITIIKCFDSGCIFQKEIPVIDIPYYTVVQNKNIEFRADIAGLRALAVMLVLLSHFGIPGFEFGFIGVDIFFVISGFLITRILYKDYLKNSQGADDKAALNLGTFYLRRIRRLLPAALVVIIAVNIASYFLYNSESRSDLLLNSRWALIFLANVSFLRSGSDYFQQTSEPSMLQHYWSLSVEEQFYFIWPLLFLVAASLHKMKFRAKYFRFNKRLLLLIGVVSVGSFIFLQQGFKVAPVEAYFSIFSRAWELGVGSFLGILAFHKKKDAFYSPTERYLPLIFAIVLAAVIITRNNWALLMPIPVFATGFLLYAGQDQSRVELRKSRKFELARRAILYIGAISYSLYLVHWPIFIIASHLGFINGLVTKLVLIPLSIFFAHLLWKFIEIPCQNIALPKTFGFEEKAFNFLKRRKLGISALIFCIVGSLYVVTYPSVSGRLIYSDSKLAGIADDPAILKYSDYQANITNSKEDLLNPDENLTAEDSGAANAASLPELLLAHRTMLTAALSIDRLTPIGISMFPGIAEDRSPFEKSQCQKQDTEQAPDCSTKMANTNSKRVALIGDSKMGQFAQPVLEYFSNKGWQVVPYILYGCSVLAPENKDRVNCVKRTDWVMAQLKSNKFNLVIGAVYPGTFNDQKIGNANLNKIIDYSDLTIWLTQFPTVQNPKDCINADFSYKPKCSLIVESQQTAYTSFKSMLIGKSNAKFQTIDTTLWSCVQLSCPIFLGDAFANRDGSHLSYTFIRRITPLINATLDSISNW